MTTTGRSLFVYYRVEPEALAGAVAAVRSMQVALRRAHPGLEASLLQRPPQPGAEVTLMEVYTAAEGVDGRIEAAISLAAAGLAGPVGQVPRHVEVFEPCG